MSITGSKRQRPTDLYGEEEDEGEGEGEQTNVVTNEPQHKRRRITCPICMVNDHNVYIVPCGHSVCLSCLREYVRGKLETNEQITCVICRDEFSHFVVNGDGANRHISSLIERPTPRQDQLAQRNFPEIKWHGGVRDSVYKRTFTWLYKILCTLDNDRDKLEILYLRKESIRKLSDINIADVRIILLLFSDPEFRLDAVRVFMPSERFYTLENLFDGDDLKVKFYKTILKRTVRRRTLM
jgi:hypothetical protein